MEVLCKNCKAKFKIADDKLPAGQMVSQMPKDRIAWLKYIAIRSTIYLLKFMRVPWKHYQTP